MGWVFAVGFILVALLWFATWLRRRTIRAYLLTAGAQTAGISSEYRRGRRAPRIAVRYTDNAGTERVAVKSLVSAGDAQLLAKPAVVLYHPQHRSRSEYVLVGFGKQPQRWFPVEFAPRDFSAH
ncbi:MULTISPECIES: hypothetical protein [unclassified Salinibacterium]|uniref:hypothetical protein n=1 Tax=unclassified Salinibacterium TaxID=2632331 RepID=UPI0018CE71AE|nr:MULTISPECIES: hypothetical protein [unclassified Salinibacterium]MBH0054256.1 hypothetical protein [Salinibacterium sp. SWN139]MBH0083542.1 hypothetical protein [Salinibacterium sp. SWN167]